MGILPKFKLWKGESSSSNQANNMKTNYNVNEEYFEAFRTKSYIEIWSKVQGQAKTTGQERLPSIPLRIFSHLSENILEPRQEILFEMMETSNLHHLLIDYFQASLEAFRVCESLLQIIDQMRANHRTIKRVIKLSKRSSGFTLNPSSDDRCRLILEELSSFVKLDNPLSVSNRFEFCDIQRRYRVMVDQLRAKYRKVTRRARWIRILKKASAISLVVACGTISVVTFILALHSLVGIVAAPALLLAPVAFIKKRIKSITTRELNTSSLTRLAAQLDAAAKGVFVLNRDFDTLSRLMAWLHDEMEYSKSRAEACVKDRTRQRLKELVKDLQSRESRFLEKLEELEEHIYLCFLNINRFRRLVMKEATQS